MPATSRIPGVLFLGLGVLAWGRASAQAAAVPPSPAHTVSTSFLGIQLAETASAFPPDLTGAVGPSQVLVASTGRVKVFSKAGAPALDVTLDAFFNSVRNGVATRSPRARFDRLSGRFFVTAVTASAPNRVLIAVSAASTVSGVASFSFFQFRHDLVGASPNSDTNGLATDPTLGIDANALYIGVNVLDAAGTTRIGSTAFVVKKSGLLGTVFTVLTVAPFRQMAVGVTGGPLSPQGVDNDDPAAAEGYFVGTDSLPGQLDVRRVSNPGGTPTLSGNLVVTVPATTAPLAQVHQGSVRALDAVDDRLFAAHMKKGRLFTAHNVEVNTTGVAVAGGGRNGSRWYELRNLTTTPTLFQSGTLFDPAASSPLGYWIPSVAATGQGHMVLASSRAGAAELAGIAVASRLAGDCAGCLQPPALAQAGAAAYNAQAVTPQAWGRYSQTVVDPGDDMTVWTFQEYANALNSWGVRVIRMAAPPPATPSCAAPVTVTGGTQDVTITGTSVAGSGFFDPGPDTGGPGFAQHLQAIVSGGTTVNSVTYNSPTSVTLNVTVTSPGAKDVTIVNPDGQTSPAGMGCIVVPSDLTITKTDGQASEIPGTPVVYTIVAHNVGPVTASGATVTDVFPAALSGVSWTCSASSGSSCGAASGAGNLSQAVTLLAGGAATFTVTATVVPSATGSLVNTATVALAGATDATPADNTATDTDTLVPTGDLAITKSDGQSTILSGTSVVYTIVAGNSGPSTAAATVTDTFPPAVASASWTCTASAGSSCGGASGTGNLNRPVTLLAGGSVTFTVTALVDSLASGTLVNTAAISAAGFSDPVPGNNSATDTDTVLAAADVSITKTDGRQTASAGASITYTIVAANAGPNPVTGATVADTVPADLVGAAWTCAGTGGGTCPGSGTGSFSHSVNLPVGASVTYTLTGTVAAAPRSLRNTATIALPAGMGDPNPQNNSAVDDDVLICGTETVLVPDGRGIESSLANGGVAWFLTGLRVGSSYSVELRSRTLGTPPGTLTVFRGDDGCTGSSSLSVRNTESIDPAATTTTRVSFTATGGDANYRLRLDNTSGAPLDYALAVAETTLYSAAWSTNGSYDTYFSFQNTTNTVVNGTLSLRTAAGALAGSFAISVPAGRTVGANTQALSVPRALTGATSFTHDGPPGAILAQGAIANFTSVPAYIQPVHFQAQREQR